MGVEHPTAAQQPPQNLDAEEYVLGAVLLSAQAIDAVRPLLDPADFYRESHARIYRAALSLHELGQPVDGITVADRLQQLEQLDEVGGSARIHELAALTPATLNVAHHAEIIAREARRRAVIAAGEKAARLAWEATDVEQAAAEAISLFETAIGGRSRHDLEIERWHEFESKAKDHVPALVDRLWPEAAFGFIAAPPKKGKTWVALALAVGVATGQPLFGHFTIPEPRPVLYVALEGHRAALRARVGAIARGMNIDPDSDALDQLHFLYKPAGINLADIAWAHRLRHGADQINAALVIVDVLRAGAIIDENKQGAFTELRHNLQPITSDGRSLTLLHHFGKLTETQKERAPGERMSGTGAMFGALDAAIYITGSENGARKLRLEFDIRDIAAPETLHINLDGEGTGDNQGFTYRDTARFHVLTSDEVAEDDLKAPAAEIYDWLAEQGGQATTATICFAFETSDKTIRARETRLEQLGVEVTRKRGKPTTYRILTDEELAARDQTSEPRNSDDFRGQTVLSLQQQDTSEPRKTGPLPRSETDTSLREPTNPQPPSGYDLGSTEATSEVPTSEVKPDNHAGLRDTSEPRNSEATSGALQGFTTSEVATPYGGLRAPTRARAREADAPLDDDFGVETGAEDFGTDTSDDFGGTE